MSIDEIIIELEKEALNQWCSGNAQGYLLHGSDNCTWTDNLGASEMIVGKNNILKYVGAAFAELPEHKYVMHKPSVQSYVDTAILGYQYHPFNLEGQPLTKWSATVVYRLMNGNWRMVHSHWTMLQNPSQ